MIHFQCDASRGGEKLSYVLFSKCSDPGVSASKIRPPRREFFLPHRSRSNVRICCSYYHQLMYIVCARNHSTLCFKSTSTDHEGVCIQPRHECSGKPSKFKRSARARSLGRSTALHPTTTTTSLWPHDFPSVRRRRLSSNTRNQIRKQLYMRTGSFSARPRTSRLSGVSRPCCCFLELVRSTPIRSPWAYRCLSFCRTRYWTWTAPPGRDPEHSPNGGFTTGCPTSSQRNPTAGYLCVPAFSEAAAEAMLEFALTRI